MKTCSQCKIEKPLMDFYKSKGRVQAECRVCFNKRMMRRYEERALHILSLKGGKCEICGYNKCPAALEFHHLDPSQKEFSINKRWSMKDEAIQKEIDKCILLCSNCHRETHYNMSR